MNKKLGWLLVSCLLLSHATLSFALPGDPLWSVPTFGNIGSSAAINPLNNDLYVGSANHYVYAYDSFGSAKWRFKTGAYVGSSLAVSADGLLVYAGSYDGNLYALNANDGTQAWATPFVTAGVIYSSPAISHDGATIYVGSADGRLYAVDSATGVMRWQYNVGSNVAASPAIGMDGTIYIGAENGYIYALSAELNLIDRLLWSEQISANGIASAAVDSGDRLYVGTFANEFVGIDVSTDSTQRVLWNRVMGGRVASSPAVAADGTLYVTTFDDGGLSAINPVDGGILWSMTTGGEVYSSPAVAADGTVFVGSFDGMLYAVTPGSASYAIRWSFAADSELISSPTIAEDGTVYIVSKSSTLYALEDNNGGLDTSTWPMFGRDSRHSHMTNDLDGDRLDDRFELARGLFPDQPDSDYDGYDDFVDPFPTDPNRAFYAAPTILSVTASPASVLGNGSSQLAVNVSYPELGAGTITYDWSISSAAGVISDPSIANPVFNAFNLSWDNSYYLTVDVSDGVYSSSSSTIITVEGDTDGDGMSDVFESVNGLDMNNPSDSTLDPDLDNLSNVDEYVYGTDPNNSDTDGDGLQDDYEIANGRNPLLNEAVLIIIINGLLLN